jgi:hypothetical protein
MTKFDKSLFNYHGGYLTYGPERKFVARFKYRGSDRASFQSFLIKNFTVEEYFTLRETPDPANSVGNSYAPLTILEQKGYVLPHIRKQLVARGYPVTPAGFRQMVRDDIAARAQKVA